MKKLVSILCSVCIIAALSTTVFAATATGGTATGGQPEKPVQPDVPGISQGGGSIDSSATNGQATPPAIGELNKDLSNKANLAAAIKAFVDNKSIFMNSESTSVLRKSLILQSAGKTIKPTIAKNTAINTIVACSGTETDRAALTVNSAAMVGGMLELDMTYSLDNKVAQPEFGVLITAKLNDAINFDTSKLYIWKNDAGMSGVAMPMLANGKIIGFEFVAPHFSKYTIGASAIATTPTTPNVVAPAKTSADNNMLAIALVAASVSALVCVAVINGKKVSE